MTTILPNERVAEIRARADRATPGPWDNPGMAVIPLTFDAECNIYPPDTMKSHGFQYGGPVAVAKHRGEGDSNPDGSDADFIAHSRTDIPALCDSHDAQAQRIGELEKSLHDERFAYKIASNEALQHRAEISTLKAKLVEAERNTAHLNAGESLHDV